MLKQAILAACLLGSASVPVEATCPLTIPELVRSRPPEPVERYRTREVVPVPFSEIVRTSELVIDGVVRRLGTGLTEDRCFLYTDYAVVVNTLIAGRQRAAQTPGAQPIVVRIPGGDMVMDGVKVIARDEPLPPFADGESVVLFLTPTADAKVYQLTRSYFGAFAVTNGRMVRLLRTSGIPDDFDATSKNAFADQVRSIKSAR